MDVAIHPHLQKFIAEQITAGNYSTPDAVINSALAHLQNQVEFPPDDIEELKREIAVGAEELERGEGKAWDPEALWEEVERMHAERSRSGCTVQET
jgi:antitoxin ParD1/3/4